MTQNWRNAPLFAGILSMKQADIHSFRSSRSWNRSFSFGSLDPFVEASSEKMEQTKCRHSSDREVSRHLWVWLQQQNILRSEASVLFDRLSGLRCLFHWQHCAWSINWGNDIWQNNSIIDSFSHDHMPCTLPPCSVQQRIRWCECSAFLPFELCLLCEGRKSMYRRSTTPRCDPSQLIQAECHSRGKLIDETMTRSWRPNPYFICFAESTLLRSAWTLGKLEAPAPNWAR